jgi:hypothetical protein
MTKLWLKASFAQAAWAPILVFVCYGVAAKVFGAYLAFPHLDIFTHFLGGAAMTYFFIAAIHHGQRLVGSIPRIVQAALALGLTAVTAIVWEFLEYASDYFLHTEMNLGVSDTLSDLFFGLGGALVVSALAYLRLAKNGASTFAEGLDP